mmetsp:Transcript_1180/g.1362  ORF Transcript_1180/g.1362 Transcript_1180/m.1362 type:complete len:107 (+) Transcript_1180:92-412(+)
MPRILVGNRNRNSGKKNSYDTAHVHDEYAKPSPKMQKAHVSDRHKVGDGDTWREGVFCSKKGQHRIYFISKETGKKNRDEPPTGASEVLYLRNSERERRLNHVCKH